jgi:hypothetical protein
MEFFTRYEVGIVFNHDNIKKKASYVQLYRESACACPWDKVLLRP